MDSPAVLAVDDDELNMAGVREFLLGFPEPMEYVPKAEPVVVDWPLVVGAELTGAQLDVLEFERLWWRQAGAKEQAILERFGVSAVRYYQLVNMLIDSPAGAAFDGALVARLRRLRAAGLRRRGVRG